MHVKERRLGDGFVPGRPHMQFACAYKQFDGDHLHRPVYACKRTRLVKHATKVCIPSFVTIINPLVATSRRPTVNSRGFGTPRFDLP